MKQIFLANQTLRIQRILKPQGSAKNLAGMKKFGIRFNKAYGVKIPIIRELAKKYKPNHDLALYLWETKIHELMLLAIFIDDYKQVNLRQMGKWVKDFASWDICDQCCSNLFDKTPYAIDKIFEWTASENEFIKRAGFVLIAAMAVHNKELDDKVFLEFFTLLEREAYDERNFVKKAVNWALRQIGKRSKYLLNETIKVAERIGHQDSKSAKWIASDALREFKTKKNIYWRKRTK